MEKVFVLRRGEGEGERRGGDGLWKLPMISTSKQVPKIREFTNLRLLIHRYQGTEHRLNMTVSTNQNNWIMWETHLKIICYNQAMTARNKRKSWLTKLLLVLLWYMIMIVKTGAPQQPPRSTAKSCQPLFVSLSPFSISYLSPPLAVSMQWD